MSESQPESSPTPFIEVFPLGGFQTNCMVVTDGPVLEGKPCLIVDCGYEPAPLIEYIERNRLIPERIVLTHAHADHLAGVNELFERVGSMPLLMNAVEEAWLNDPMLNLSAALGLSITAPGPDGYLKEGDTVGIGSLAFQVRETPGHSPGSISLIHEPSETALVGDSLFNGSIGRTDFPGSSFEQLAESIRTKLYTLPPETRVYPGHGPTTTIAQEMRSNPFVPAH